MGIHVLDDYKLPFSPECKKPEVFRAGTCVTNSGDKKRKTVAWWVATVFLTIQE
jgi:hypothetical protein